MDGGTISRQMSEVESEDLIISILKGADKPMMTREIEVQVAKGEAQCPDSAARFLNKLRFKGMIKGKLSIEDKGWLWWLE